VCALKYITIAILVKFSDFIGSELSEKPDFTRAVAVIRRKTTVENYTTFKDFVF